MGEGNEFSGWSLDERSTEPVEAWFFEPHPSLRLAVTAYYFLRMPEGGAVDILHPDWFNFRFFVEGRGRMRPPGREWINAPTAAIVGPLSRAPLIEISGYVAAVGILPYGWARLVGLPADQFADVPRPVADALGLSGDALFTRLREARSLVEMREQIDGFFTGLFHDRPEPAPIVSRAHELLMCKEVRTVEHWAARLEVSARQLERISRIYFGMSPKRLLRRQRFLRTMAAIWDSPSGTWAQQLDDQYADQAQFSREFRFFMGVSPRAYFSRPSPIMGPAAAARKAALGEPAQALHPPASEDRLKTRQP